MFKIAAELNLPADASTQTFGFFGRKGSGKTYAAGLLVEVFLERKVQVVVLDPVGNWYALRLDKSGKRPSAFDIPILGGTRGDVPLESTGGQLVADTIVDTGTPAVLDVSHFRKAERKRFVADFAEQLFHRKKSRGSPLHLVIEEAQLFAPQMAKGEERLLGAIEDLVRLGRNYGIGVSMLSQRPQSINTEVRNQCEPLVVFQLVAKHERDAVAGWMQHMGVDAELAALSKFKTGDCFFWSPAWLDKFVRTRFHAKRTFDGSSTPTGGGGGRSPARLKALDLSKLKSAMAETIARTKAEDPATLKAEIVHLRALRDRLETTKAAAAAPKAKPPREVKVVTDGQIKRLEKSVEQIKDAAIALQALAATLAAAIRTAAPTSPAGQATPPRPPAAATAAPTPAVRSRPNPAPNAQANGAVGKGGLRRMLVALAQRPQGLTAEQLGVRAQLSSKSGTFDVYLGRARSNDWIAGDRSRLQITEAGVAALGTYEPLPTGRDLLAYWVGKLGNSGAARMLSALAHAYPSSLTKAELGELAQISSSSGTFDVYLGKLRRLELVDGKTAIKATNEFFTG